MTQQITPEQEKELQEILELTKEGEDKLLQISEISSDLAQKCQRWYEEGMVKKEKQC